MKRYDILFTNLVPLCKSNNFQKYHIEKEILNYTFM